MILLCNYRISGPSLFMILEKEEAISGWRKMIGYNDPEIAKENDPNSYVDNLIH